MTRVFDSWLEASQAAATEASKYLTKKGTFNPPLEKPWPEWERLRVIADEEWNKCYQNHLTNNIR